VFDVYCPYLLTFRLTPTKDNHSQLLQHTTVMPSEFNNDIQTEGMCICKLTKMKTVSDKITAPVQLHG
jgi:hypothetical protein